MTATNIVDKIFTEAFEAAVLIEFNPDWANGTGYYDNAVSEKLEIAEVRKTITSNDRRMLLIGTRYGTIVVFDRYSGPEHRVFVSNTPRSTLIDTLVPSGAIGERAMAIITGGWSPSNNIGKLIETIMNDVKRPE
jgi:hypothetical protein